MLFKRLKQLGIFGYIKFIIKKQGNNTADGTFGWLKEGHFFRENQKPTTKTISGKLKTSSTCMVEILLIFVLWHKHGGFLYSVLSL